jgi:hypothetical protein
MATAAIDWSLRTLRASAFNGEAMLGPKAALTNDLFHTFEPPQIFGVVIWKIKKLWLSCQEVNAIAHVWPIRLVCPEMLWILGDIDKTNSI